MPKSAAPKISGMQKDPHNPRTAPYVQSQAQNMVDQDNKKTKLVQSLRSKLAKRAVVVMQENGPIR